MNNHGMIPFIVFICLGFPSDSFSMTLFKIHCATCVFKKTTCSVKHMDCLRRHARSLYILSVYDGGRTA